MVCSVQSVCVCSTVDRPALYRWNNEVFIKSTHFSFLLSSLHNSQSFLSLMHRADRWINWAAQAATHLSNAELVDKVWRVWEAERHISSIDFQTETLWWKLNSCSPRRGREVKRWKIYRARSFISPPSGRLDATLTHGRLAEQQQT